MFVAETFKFGIRLARSNIARVAITFIVVATLMSSLKRTVAATWNANDICDEIETIVFRNHDWTYEFVATHDTFFCV